MDKQMIEEMAKVIGETFTYAKKYYYDKYEPFELEVYPDDIASELYNAGYRKIPEGAVVVSKQVWDEHIENWDKTSKAIEERVRKETAEKFAERLKEKCKMENNPLGFKVILINDSTVDEICKEIIGETK